MKLTKAKRLRRAIEQASETLDDAVAVDVPELFPMWHPDTQYEIGERFQRRGLLYKVLIAHRSQTDWLPENTPSLYAVVLIPDPEVIPEWVQPDSTNPYMTGDKVTHNGKTWISTIDNNIWEPGIYGWDEIGGDA